MLETQAEPSTRRGGTGAVGTAPGGRQPSSSGGPWAQGWSQLGGRVWCPRRSWPHKESLLLPTAQLRSSPCGGGCPVVPETRQFFLLGLQGAGLSGPFAPTAAPRPSPPAAGREAEAWGRDQGPREPAAGRPPQSTRTALLAAPALGPSLTVCLLRRRLPSGQQGPTRAGPGSARARSVQQLDVPPRTGLPGAVDVALFGKRS